MTERGVNAASPATNSGWAEAARDVVAGLMASSRLLLMACGAVSLAGGAALAVSPQARDWVAHAVPSRATPVALAVSEIALEAAAAQGVATPVVHEEESSDEEYVVSADPTQRAVTRYLSRRYRVADEAVGRLVAASFAAAQERNVDPLLVLAVMAVESSMNPFAESTVGAQGLMQVMTRVHADKFVEHGGELAALDPFANIEVGTVILADAIRRGGSVDRGLQLYVGAGNLPDDGGYGARVLAEHARLKLATVAGPGEAVAAGLQADRVRAMPAALRREEGGSAGRPGAGVPGRLPALGTGERVSAVAAPARNS